MALTPQEWTISGLATETGITHRKLSEMLKDVDPIVRNGRKYYRIRAVCDALRGGGIRAQEAERTRLYTAQADHEELRVSEKRAELIPAEVIEQTWCEKTAAAKAKLIALPARIAQVALAATSLREVEEVVRVEVYAALNELAKETRPGKPTAESDVGTSPDSKGERVGRAKPPSQSRKQRGTRTVAKQ